MARLPVRFHDLRQDLVSREVVMRYLLGGTILCLILLSFFLYGKYAIVVGQQVENIREWWRTSEEARGGR